MTTLASQRGADAPVWLIKGLGAGGAEALLLAHAEERARRNEPSEVVYLRADRDALRPAFEELGVTVHCLGRRDEAGWRSALRLVAFLWKRRGALVHVHSPALAPLVRVVSLVTRAKVVYTEHNRWTQYRWPTRVLNAITYPLDDRRVFVSDGVRSSTWWTIGAESEVLHHGTDLSARPNRGRAEIRREFGIGDDIVVVITVANLRREKAPFDLLEAARSLSDDEACRVHFVWVGQGPLEAEFRRAIQERSLVGRVTYAGYRTDITDLLHAADIFCLSSHHEGLPVALMEALVAGLPVVATDVGGVGEAVGGDAACGVLVPAGATGRLARELVALADDEPRRRELGQRAVERSGRFDAARAVERIEQIYAEVVRCAA